MADEDTMGGVIIDDPKPEPVAEKPKSTGRGRKKEITDDDILEGITFLINSLGSRRPQNNTPDSKALVHLRGARDQMKRKK